MLLGRRRALWISALLIMNGFNRRKRDKDLAGGNDGNNLKLPSFKNALEVKSSIPGRVRFYAPILVGNIEVANSFVDQISKIDVIKTCRVNTLTGTILMEYDHQLLDPQTLEGAVIKLLGVDKSIDEGRVSEVKKASERLLDVKSLAGIALIGAGLLDLRRNGGGRLPDYATLGWWGTSLFMM